MTEAQADKSPGRHPTWLTPLVALSPVHPGDEPRPETSIEEKTAALGLIAGDAWWIELQFTGWDLWDLPRVIPVVLDGNFPFWHSSFRPGLTPNWGYSMDLRETGGDDVPLLPELIVECDRSLWLRAWLDAGCRIECSNAEEWRRLCGCKTNLLPWDTLQDRRERHRRRLANMP